MVINQVIQQRQNPLYNTTISPYFEPSQDVDFLSAEGGLTLYRLTQQESNCIAPNRPMLKAVNRATRQVVFFRPACKSWGCPGCAQKRAKRWVYVARHGTEALLQQGLHVDFLTVTSHEKLGAVGSLSVLSSAWNKLNRRIHRAADTADYFLVPEPHKNGRWHIHAIITAKLPKRWWKDNARACGFGYQSDVQEVRTLGGVHFYVTKYLTKSLQNSNLPRGFRRVRVSQGWPDLPELPSSPDWIFIVLERDRAVAWDVEAYEREGFSVVITDENGAWEIVNSGYPISASK